MQGKSYLENIMGELLKIAGYKYIREYRFCERLYRLDFFLPEFNIGIEVQGGNYSRDRLGHSSPLGLKNDYEKVNELTISGIKVLQFDSNHLKRKNQGYVLLTIRRATEKLLVQIVPVKAG